MKKKRIIAGILCFVFLFSFNCGELKSYASDFESDVYVDETTEEIVTSEELTEEDIQEPVITEETETDESTVEEQEIDIEAENEIQTDSNDDFDDFESEESVDLIDSTIMDEAVALKYNTNITYKFSKGVIQRRVYKITASKDAILHYYGKVFADSNDYDRVNICLYDENGKDLQNNTYGIETNMGFSSFDRYFCFPKGNYYLVFLNSYYGDDIGTSSSYIGTDSISFTATLEYPTSTEKENNDNFNKAQTITGGTTQYGVIPEGDEYDTYKIKVDYSGDLQIDLNGYNLGDEHHNFYMELFDSSGKSIKYKSVIYSSNNGCSVGSLVKSVDPGTYYIQIYSYYQGYYNFTTTVPGKYKSDGLITTSGIYCMQNSPSIVAGMVIDKSNYLDDVEYRWVACDSNNPGNWIEVSPWTVNNQWLNWTPSKSGDYVLVCYARVLGNETKSLISANCGVEFHKYIKAQCQMPYIGKGGGYLIGFETYSNPNQSYSYEMLILDCTLLQQGKDAWVYSTGKCKVSQGNALWTIWQPKYGYYWTLFRLYDKNGNMIDQVCYGFQNIF